ncbi:MAG: AbrB/MazE/SpoVT family DNA-binding domain-containing protein [Blastocatellia bacterium]
MTIREMIMQEIAGLSEAKLYQVADFLAFLNFHERINSSQVFGNERITETPSLEKLLEGITEQNLHREIDYGPAVGKEVW